jgi:hypothetical protein
LGDIWLLQEVFVVQEMMLNPQGQQNPGIAQAKAGDYVRGIVYPQYNTADSYHQREKQKQHGKDPFPQQFEATVTYQINEYAAKHKHQQGVPAGKTKAG